MPRTPPIRTRQYPHVDGVTDWRAQQSLRLLWDRVFDLTERLQATDQTVGDLATTQDAQDNRLTEALRLAQEALASAQLTPEARAALAGLHPGEPATGPGSLGEPIVPMSDDLTTIEANIKASLYHWSRADYGYWFRAIHSGAPWQGGDSKWYVGWDAYMEQRAAPGDAGVAPHDLYPLPAVYTTPPPGGYPSGGWEP